MHTGAQWNLLQTEGHTGRCPQSGAGDAWAVFYQTPRMFCEDFLVAL